MIKWIISAKINVETKKMIMLIKLYMDKKECTVAIQRFDILMCQYERIIYKNKRKTNTYSVIIKIY